MFWIFLILPYVIKSTQAKIIIIFPDKYKLFYTIASSFLSSLVIKMRSARNLKIILNLNVIKNNQYFFLNECKKESAFV